MKPMTGSELHGASNHKDLRCQSVPKARSGFISDFATVSNPHALSTAILFRIQTVRLMARPKALRKTGKWTRRTDAYQRAITPMTNMSGLAELKFVAHGQPIDLSTWQLVVNADDLFNIISKGLASQITEIIRTNFRTSPPDAYFPFQWADDNKPSDGIGGPPVADPVMIYVDLPLSAASDIPCTFSISLEDIVDAFIDSSRPYPTCSKIYKREIPDKIAARLRALAQKIDDTRPTEDEQAQYDRISNRDNNNAQT
jgi:hypothetical protein